MTNIDYPTLNVSTFCRLAVLIAGLGMAITAAAQATEPHAVPDDISRWISKLSADRFAERQAAMRKLIEFGRDVVESLESSIQGGEPEMRMRSMAVLQRLAISQDPETQTVAQAAIQRLAESADGDIRRLAQQTMSRLAEALQESAVDELQKLGADIEEFTGSIDGIRYSKLYTVSIATGWRGTADDLKLLQWVRDISSLTLIGDQITDETIGYLSQYEQLQSLVIKRASITNSCLETLVNLRSLSSLQFVYCKIDDDSLSLLEKLHQLASLQLYGTQVSRDAATKLADQLNITVDHRKGAFLGVYYNRGGEVCEITRVVPGSSADQGGIKAGDVIVAFDQQLIKSADDFQGAVANFTPGQTVVVEVLRSEQQLKLEITLGEFMDEETLR